MPTTPEGPRDITNSCSTEELLQVRQRALELASARISEGEPERYPERRQRVTEDAAAYVEFMLTGKVFAP